MSLCFDSWRNPLHGTDTSAVFPDAPCSCMVIAALTLLLKCPVCMMDDRCPRTPPIACGGLCLQMEPGTLRWSLRVGRVSAGEGCIKQVVGPAAHTQEQGTWGDG